MPRHSSPVSPFDVPGARPPTHDERHLKPLTTVIPRPRTGLCPSRRGDWQSSLALAAVVAGAASVGLSDGSTLSAMEGEVTSAPQEAPALMARAATPSPGPDPATSQILAVPALDVSQRSDPEGDVQLLRKADDRRAAEKRGQDQRREEAIDARRAVGGAATAGAFARPVAGRVTSNYGSRGGGTHYGLDVANRIGAPVRSAAPGTVISAGPASGFGMWVRVRHEDGTITVYGHINRALVDVGQEVSVGEVIAEVGNRGRSTGPHLHFEAHSADGEKLDPGRWLDQRGVGF